MRLSTLTALATALLAAPAVAGVDDDAELWTTVTASGPVSGRLLLEIQAQARFSDDGDGIYETQFGGLLGYRFTDTVAVWAGYVRVPRYARDAPTEVEDRTRQQVTATLGKLLGGTLSSRVRLEQRFRESGGTGWRLRPQLGFSRPLTRNGPELALSHESFVELNDTAWGQDAGYRRMRNAVGISIPLAKGVATEVGYLNQAEFERGRDSIDHVFNTTLSYEF